MLVNLMPRCFSLLSRFVLSALILAACCGNASAVPPTISTLSPGAVAPGTTTEVTVRGSNLAGATRLWTSFPAKSELAAGVSNNGKKAGDVVFRVSVPEDAPVGIHGVRVRSPNGVSGLRLFVVDDLRTVAQKSRNTNPSAAQPVKLPIAVEGTVGSLSRHYFAFTAKAGERVSFEVLAGRIGSPLDPMITLFAVTENGLSELAYNDDARGLHGDARLSYRFEETRKYVLELRDIAYKGGGEHRFRLRMGDFPCVTVTYPMGAQRGTETTLNFAGSSTENVEPLKVAVPTDPDLSWMPVAVKRRGGQSSGFALLAVSESEEALEKEPNNVVKQATRVKLGANINGRLETPGDVDRFTFTAKKGGRFTFNAVTRRQGSPTDVLLQLHDANGKQLAEADDAGTEDGRIAYTFPADGEYQLVVQDHQGRGGPEFAYRVVVSEAVPAFQLSATADRVNVPAGGTATLTVEANRNGYNGAVRIEAAGLPDGVTSAPTVLGPGRNSVMLSLTASEGAKLGSVEGIRIVGTAKIKGKTITRTADVDAALKKLAGGYPFPTPTLSRALVAAVTGPAPFAAQVSPQTVTLSRGKKATVKVTLNRGKTITEAVALALASVPKKNPKKAGLPSGITVSAKSIPKGKNEVELVISTTKKAPKGTFTATVFATHKRGKTTIRQPLPGILIQVK